MRVTKCCFVLIREAEKEHNVTSNMEREKRKGRKEGKGKEENMKEFS